VYAVNSTKIAHASGSWQIKSWSSNQNFSVTKNDHLMSLTIAIEKLRFYL